MQRFGWSLVFSYLGRVDGLVACVQGFAMAMKLRVEFGRGWLVVILFIRQFINHRLHIAVGWEVDTRLSTYGRYSTINC
jgi:hypothetical protein